MGEAGLLLAEEGSTPAAHGCVTPSIALGTDGIERFARAGLTYSGPS
jgi:short subunit dehydrogenase-like uncharacterized protein